MEQNTVLTNSGLYTLFVMITTALSMALIRGFLPLLLFVLRDRLGWSAIALGVAALLLFLTAIFTALLNKALGTGRLLAGTAVVVALASLVVQWWSGDPMLDLVVSVVGVAAFGFFLPTLIGVQLQETGGDKQATTMALSGGLLLALVIHGSARTYDLMWQQGLTAGLVLLLLVVVQMACLVLLRGSLAAAATADPPGLCALAWSAIGPFLSLQLLIFLNLARLTTLSGWLLPAAFLALTLVYLAGIGLLYVPVHWRRGITAVGLLLLLVSLVLDWPVAFTLVGATTCTALLQGMIDFLARRQTYSGLGRLTAFHTIGMVLLAVHVFVTYARFDMALPLGERVLLAAALLWLAFWGLLGMRGPKNLLAVNGRSRRVAAVLPLLLLAPGVQWLVWQQPTTAAAALPLRVMTYNLHNGFNPDGLLDLEALAQVIEVDGADVVGLQEVSRGWVVNGSADMLTWLAQRLGMTAVFMPTADELWGIAILSRVPLANVEGGPLPPNALLMRRGWLAVEIDVANERPLRLVNTHLHHPEDGGPVRQTQVQALLAALPDPTRTLVMGDFNAEPAAAEMESFWTNGWRDAIEVAELAPGFTSPASAPSRRIDYLLATPDLTLNDVTITAVTASDHLPVSATVE